MDIAIQAAVALMAIAVIVFLILSIKSWKWFHIFCCFLVFCAAIPVVAYTAIVLKTQVAWMGLHQAYETEVLAQAKIESQLLEGDNLAVKQSEPTINDVQNELARLMTGRGRVWRNAVFQRNNGANVSLTLEAAPAPAPAPADPAEAPDPAAGEPAAPAAPAVPPTIIEEESLVYAFLEAPVPDAGYKVPAVFMGEYTVSVVNGTNVELAAVGTPDAVQAAAMGAAGFTWVLYETMPVDGHEVFQGDDMQADAIEQYIPSEADLARLIPITLFSVDMTPAQHAEKIKEIREQWKIEYMYDTQPVSEIQKIHPDFDPPPEQIWVDVTFLQTHEVDVDAAGEGVDDFDRGGFEVGKAVASRLRQGSKTKFEINDTARFPLAGAQELETQNIVKLGTRYFYRELRNYQGLFHDLEEAQLALQFSAENIKLETASVRYSLSRVRGPDTDTEGGQLLIKRTERENLRADLEFLRKERDFLVNYAETLTSSYASSRQRLSQLYRANNSMAAELARIQNILRNEIERRAAEAVETEPASTPADDTGI